MNHDEADDFASFCTPHEVAIRRLVALRVRPADVDDVVQEVLVRAWQKRSTYRAERGSARNWLLALAADRARHAARRRLPSAAFTDVDRIAAAGDVDRDVDLRRAIATLSARQRDAIALYYYADLAVGTVAELLRVSEGTVKSTLADARKRLASLLEDSYARP